MCSNYSVFSRLENCVNRLRLRYGRGAGVGAKGKGTKKGKAGYDMSNRLVEGKTVCCVWERKLKPFAVKMVKIRKVRGSGISGGLAEVTLDNGITFRGSAMKSCHLFQDKERLAGALEAPTRANVLIFTHGVDAEKHLKMKGCAALGDGIDFRATEAKPAVKAEEAGLTSETEK